MQGTLSPSCLRLQPSADSPWPFETNLMLPLQLHAHAGPGARALSCNQRSPIQAKPMACMRMRPIQGLSIVKAAK